MSTPHLSYEDLDDELLDALRAVESGCGSWIENDPRLAKLHQIDENLLFFYPVDGRKYEVRLGSSGIAYLAGLARSTKSR